MALLAVMLAMADSVTPERALSMAQAFMSGGKATFCASADVSLKLAYQAHSLEGKPDYYVFNRGNGGGYIVVTGDDRTVPVWGYSTNGTFDYESLPENAKWWLSEYQRQLQYLRDHPEAKARQTAKLTTYVGPLLTTEWNQNYPFNMMCPNAADPFHPDYHDKAPTGCYATALAQIMNFHKWPKVGRGSINYSCEVTFYELNPYWSELPPFPVEMYDEKSYTAYLGANFSLSVYNWDLIEEFNSGISNPQNINAIAKLMYDVGVAIKTKYDVHGSSADYITAANNIRTFFDYGVVTCPKSYWQQNYPDIPWDDMLRSAIDSNHPLFYYGYEPNIGEGHGFVLDGYDSNGLFHFNWGWGDTNWNDCYFASDLVEPVNGMTFNSEHAVLDLVPNNEIKSLSGFLKDSSIDVVNKGSTGSTTLSVLGQNLDQDVNISLVGNDASMFSTVGSISASEANAQGGKTVKLVYAPTAVGTHTAQIVVSAGDDVDSVILTVTGTAKLYCDADGDEQLTIDDLTFAIDQLLAGGELNYTGTYASIEDITSIIDALLGTSATINVDDGLVAYYPFNGNANDESGNGNHGQVTNIALTQGVNGDSDGAYQFGGYYNQGYIRVPNSESLKFTDGFTFACYVKPTDWTGMDGWGNYSNNSNSDRLATHAIFGKSGDRNGPVLEMNCDNTKMHVWACSISGQSQWSSLSSGDRIGSTKLNEWVHIAVAYSNSLARMYINGILVDQKAITPNFSEMNANDLYLGLFPALGTMWYPLNGVMDEVRIYNRALNSAEINELAMDNEISHPFKLSKREVTLVVGETVMVNMLNGSGCYSVGSNVGIVDFTLNGDSFTLTGTGVGTTNVTVIDVATQTTILLPVTVIQPDNKKLLLSEEVNGVRYRLFKEVLDENDTHVNGDGWTFYRSKLSLDVIRNNVVRTYILDENLYLDPEISDAQTATMLFDLRTSEMKVFINSKTSGQNYSMNGYCYTSSMNSIAFSKETVFSAKNWGWWPFWVYSNGSISLSHFSYAGYYYMTSSRNESGTWSNTTGRKIYPDDFRSIWEQSDLTLVIQQ